MALPRRAKQKGIQLMNYGKKRNEKLTNQDFPKDCVICLDQVECRGAIICEHWFCFVCIQEWSKKTNTCPLCKQRFRCITKVSIGSKNNAPQKFRVKDKNQNNVSFAEDDYDVAMGLVDESSDNSIDDSNDLDETFQPSSHRARNNFLFAPTNRSRPSVRGSTREASQQVLERYAANNTEDGHRLIETRQSSRRMLSNQSSPSVDANSISAATISHENTIDDNDTEEGSLLEQMSPNSLPNNLTEDVADEEEDKDNEDGEEEEDEEEEPVIVTKRRKKRRTIVYRSPKRKKQRSTDQWIDMSAKRTTCDRGKRSRPRQSRSPLSRSVKEKAVERMKEQYKFLNTSITSLMREQLLSPERSSAKSPEQDESIEELSQVNIRKSKFKRLRVVDSSSEDDDCDKDVDEEEEISHQKRKNEESHKEPCCSRSVAKHTTNRSVGNFEINFVDSDSDVEESVKYDNQLDLEVVPETKNDNQPDEQLVSKAKTKKKYTFRKTKTEAVTVDNNVFIITPAVQPSLHKTNSCYRRKQRHRISTNTSTCKRKNSISLSSPACAISDNETCFLSSNHDTHDPGFTPGARNSRDKTIDNISDINISINSNLEDDIISPCVLSQVSQRTSSVYDNSFILTTPKKTKSKSSREIVTTPVNRKIHSPINGRESAKTDLIGSPDLFENMESSCSRNKSVKPYTYKKFRRNFRHYSPTHKPLKNIVNIQSNTSP